LVYSSFQPGRTSRKSFVKELLVRMRTPSAHRSGAIVVLSVLSAFATFSALQPVTDSATESSAFEKQAVAPIWPLPSALEVSESGNHRSVFPYSVIPGGAQSAEELKKAVAMDPVVAQHYSDFDLASVRRVTLSQPQLLYVSYRVGNNVFWTKKKLALAKGETLLTDGHSMARTRCGNRVSVLPVRPNALVEPAPSVFDTPEFPPSISTPYLAAFSAPPAFPSGPDVRPSGTPGSSFTPLAPFFPFPGGGNFLPPPGGSGGGDVTPPPGGGGGSGGVTPPPGGGGGNGSPPPADIPEPGTAVLVLAGLAAVWFVHRTRKAW
jgi:hypothetical protein